MKLYFFPALCFISLSFSAQCQDWNDYYGRAKQFRGEKNNDSAIAYYKKTTALLQATDAPALTRIKILREMAELSLSLAHYNEALTAFENAGNLLEQSAGETDSVFIVNTSQLALAFFRTGQLDKSGFFFEKARSLKGSAYGKQTTVYAAACTNVANVLATAGKYNAAEQLYLESRDIIRAVRGTSNHEYAQCCNGLASLYTSMGQFSKAESLAVEAREIRGKLYQNDSAYGPVYALSCITLANLCTTLGQYDKAAALYQEAMRLRKMAYGENHPLFASACSILGDLYYYKRDYANAEALYLEAKEIRRHFTAQNKIDYAQSCNNLAALYIEKGVPGQSLPLALEAKSIYEDLLEPDDPQLPLNYNNVANIYFALGKWDSANAYFLKARALWTVRPGKEHPYFSQNAASLARVYWNQHNLQQAKNLYRESIRSQLQQIHSVFQFTNENEKQLYLDNIGLSLSEINSFYYAACSHRDAGELYNNALNGRNLIAGAERQLKQSVLNSKDTAARTVYNQWTGLKEQLANLYVKSYATQHQTINDLAARADVLEKQLARSSRAFADLRRQSITWQDLRSKLKKDEAAIEFIQFNYFNGRKETDSIYYAALILKNNNTPPQLVWLFEQRQLAEQLNPAIASAMPFAAQGLSRGVTPVAGVTYDYQTLYALVWKPMEKYLAGIRSVSFAAAGLLHRLPFAALVSNKKELLMDKYRLTQLSSTALLLQQHPAFIPRSGKILAYGNINYNKSDNTMPGTNVSGGTALASWTALAGTLDEVDAIKAIAEKNHFNIELRTGSGATERSLKAGNEQGTMAVLHIASHGFFNPLPLADSIDKTIVIPVNANAVAHMMDNPLLRAGLVFAGANTSYNTTAAGKQDDGILTAYEVANLALNKTQLVVLSACETAGGDLTASEGVYGLQRSFRMAGVQYMIMSLWKVKDDEAAAFMKAFYSSALGGKSIPAAFRAAQLFMRKNYPANPYPWAAWVLIQ